MPYARDQDISRQRGITNDVARIIRSCAAPGGAVRLASTCYPSFHVAEWNSSARLNEGIQSSAILADIRPGNIDDGIQQRHGLGKHGRNVLTALVYRSSTRRWK
jgi:hypothetical protein